MSNNKELDALLQILSGEQTIIQRTDQKAFTLLSILGAFMVFFIVKVVDKCLSVTMNIFFWTILSDFLLLNTKTNNLPLI